MADHKEQGLLGTCPYCGTASPGTNPTSEYQLLAMVLEGLGSFTRMAAYMSPGCRVEFAFRHC